MRQFFMALPKELEEAAIIDGCNRGMVYTKIMLPLIQPGMISLGILVLKFAWNNMLWPLIVIRDADKMPLSVGLNLLQGEHFQDYPTIMAGALLSIMPLIIIFAIFQKRFIEGIAFTGGK